MLPNDNADPNLYRTSAQAAATASLLSSLTQPRAVRVTRLLQDIRETIDNLPSGPFVADDDHVGTAELRLTPSDSIAEGKTQDKTLKIESGEGNYELMFRIAHHRRTVFTPNTHLAAVTRNDTHMEIWAVGVGGMVRGTWFDGQWHDWYVLLWSFEG
jgi:hypothetical protein